MHLSTHYYVLSLGSRTTALFEAFRDSLITVENQGFPVVAPTGASDGGDVQQIAHLARTIDKCFSHYHAHDPLGLIVVGEETMQLTFSSVTVYENVIIGRIKGDHTATPTHALGQIAWSVVKEAMSGARDAEMRDAEASAKRGDLASGLEAVARVVSRGATSTLLVEDDYCMRGSIGPADQLPIISPDVDVRDVMDDAVDAVINKVLLYGGNVVFVPHGSLRDRDRIVLKPR